MQMCSINQFRISTNRPPVLLTMSPVMAQHRPCLYFSNPQKIRPVPVPIYYSTNKSHNTMKAALPRMLQEEEIEPFIIDLSTPCSTPPSSPTFEEDEIEFSLEPNSNSPSKRGTHDFLSETDGTSVLDFLFSPPPTPSLGLFETLLADPSPAARAAILYYLPMIPVVQHQITTLVPPMLHDFEVMASLATNIAYFNAHGFIPEWELEYLLMQILVCPNPAGTNTSVLDPRIICLYHLTLDLIPFFRDVVVPKQKLAEQTGRENMRKLWNVEHEMQRRRKAELAALALPYESHLDAGVPLPYGCSTMAQVFTEVNETYTHEAPPNLYWALSRPTYHVHHRNRDTPVVRLPCRDTDKRVPLDSKPESMVFSQEDEMFSMSRVGVEELFAWEEGQGARVQVKLPHVTDRQ
jgi:hypothetical protein